MAIFPILSLDLYILFYFYTFRYVGHLLYCIMEIFLKNRSDTYKCLHMLMHWVDNML